MSKNCQVGEVGRGKGVTRVANNFSKLLFFLYQKQKRKLSGEVSPGSVCLREGRGERGRGGQTCKTQNRPSPHEIVS